MTRSDGIRRTDRSIPQIVRVRRPEQCDAARVGKRDATETRPDLEQCVHVAVVTEDRLLRAGLRKATGRRRGASSANQRRRLSVRNVLGSRATCSPLAWQACANCSPSPSVCPSPVRPLLLAVGVLQGFTTMISCCLGVNGPTSFPRETPINSAPIGLC